MPPQDADDLSALQKAREKLYTPTTDHTTPPASSAEKERSFPHAWDESLRDQVPHRGARQIRLASLFFFIALLFFLVSLAAAGYFFYFGGNSVSVDKVSITIQGPTTIAGGDTVPLALSIVNNNPVPLENATIEIGFPSGTLSADGSFRSYPRYTEPLGTIESGATITRSLQAIIFGSAGQTFSLPISLTYGTSGSASDFIKQSVYALAISSTPLSVSVESLTETVSGKPLTFALTVRSNASIPLENVALVATFPFGFKVTGSSLPLSGSRITLGTIRPGESKTFTVTGTLSGEDGEQRFFRFTVGTTQTPGGDTLALTYMTQETSVTITAPFIATTLAINGSESPNPVLSPGATQSVKLSYANTLATSIANAEIAVTLSGAAVDYESIRTTNGFYRSSDHTIVFSRDTDPSLATLAPGDSGIGTFSFATLPPSALPAAPDVTFTTSVSGTRIGQAQVPEKVSATAVKTAKVSTAALLTVRTLYSSGPLTNSGPIPPKVEQSTTYSVVWDITNRGNTVADGKVTTLLPGYVTYTNRTSGAGSFSYDEQSHTVTWSTGDLAPSANVVGVFQVALTPSLSQKGGVPELTGEPAFTGYDRFTGMEVSASSEAATTETKDDPGYSSAKAVVQ